MRFFVLTLLAAMVWSVVLALHPPLWAQIVGAAAIAAVLFAVDVALGERR